MTIPTKTKPSSGSARDQRTTMIIGGVVAAAVVVALIFILISSASGTGSDIHKYDDIPQTRTADGAFVLGNPDAPLTIVEFADWACPACQQYKPTVDRFLEEYVRTGQAKFESRIIMTAGGAVTGYAAQLAECADEQRPGGYWQAYVLLYDYASRGAGNYNTDMARPFAQSLDLDLNALLTCARTAEQVTNDAAFAGQTGANATPTVLFRLSDGQARQLPAGRAFDDLANLVSLAQAQSGS